MMRKTEIIFSNHIDVITQAVLLLFESMKTEYKRLKLFTETGYLVHTKIFTVGDVVENKGMDGRIVKQIVSVTAQFIPVRKTLRTFLSLPNVYE